MPSNKELVLEAIRIAITLAKTKKPNDRSEDDRYYAITVTDLEKVYALFKEMVK